MAQVTSMIADGVFQQFPTLRVAVLEIGFAWMPPLLWRLDMEWKGLRRIVPWLDRLPSAIVHDHFRFSTAPLDLESPAVAAEVVEWLGEDLLMFATDYPHAHGDDPGVLLQALSAEAREKVLGGTAREFYRLAK
jgi:predicted TIM-barrel fold metal-dependent hydrolase